MGLAKRLVWWGIELRLARAAMGWKPRAPLARNPATAPACQIPRISGGFCERAQERMWDQRVNDWRPEKFDPASIRSGNSRNISPARFANRTESNRDLSPLLADRGVRFSDGAPACKTVGVIKNSNRILQKCACRRKWSAWIPTCLTSPAFEGPECSLRHFLSRTFKAPPPRKHSL